MRTRARSSCEMAPLPSPPAKQENETRKRGGKQEKTHVIQRFGISDRLRFINRSSRSTIVACVCDAVQRAVAYRSHSPYHVRHMLRRKECNIAKSRGVQIPLALPRTTHATAQHCKEPWHTDSFRLTTHDMLRWKECNIAKSRGVQIPLALPRTTHATEEGVQHCKEPWRTDPTRLTTHDTCHGATLQRAVPYRSHSPYHVRHMLRRKECNIVFFLGSITTPGGPSIPHPKI